MRAKVLFQLAHVEYRMDAHIRWKLEFVSYTANLFQYTIRAVELCCELHGLANSEGSHSVGLHSQVNHIPNFKLPLESLPVSIFFHAPLGLCQVFLQSG